MEFTTLTETRRTVRVYRSGTVSREQIEELIQTTLQAPSWKNSETGRYYAAITPEKVEQVRACLPAGNQKKSENASALIVTTFVKNVAGHTEGKPDNEPGNEWGAYDLGLQAAYLILKARDMGLDTLIMGLRDADGLRRVMEIPETEEIMAVIALGYRDTDPATPRRKAVEEVLAVR